MLLKTVHAKQSKDKLPSHVLQENLKEFKENNKLNSRLKMVS